MSKTNNEETNHAQHIEASKKLKSSPDGRKRTDTVDDYSVVTVTNDNRRESLTVPNFKNLGHSNRRISLTPSVGNTTPTIYEEPDTQC